MKIFDSQKSFTQQADVNTQHIIQEQKIVISDRDPVKSSAKIYSVDFGSQHSNFAQRIPKPFAQVHERENDEHEQSGYQPMALSPIPQGQLQFSTVRKSQNIL